MHFPAPVLPDRGNHSRGSAFTKLSLAFSESDLTGADRRADLPAGRARPAGTILLTSQEESWIFHLPKRYGSGLNSSLIT